MKYLKTVTLKDNRKCIIRNGTESDSCAALEIFLATHEQTDFLLSYPDENTLTEQDEGKYLKEKTESADEIELVAEIDGKIVGLAGIDRIGTAEKVRHRAEFGVSIDKDYWNLGLGRAMTISCVECAKKAGYAQLELDVVANNTAAVSLYKSIGFTEYGRNPKGFCSRIDGFQELILMRLELK